MQTHTLYLPYNHISPMAHDGDSGALIVMKFVTGDEVSHCSYYIMVRASCHQSVPAATRPLGRCHLWRTSQYRNPGGGQIEFVWSGLEKLLLFVKCRHRRTFENADNRPCLDLFRVRDAYDLSCDASPVLIPRQCL